MNFLAHAYLSFELPEILVGNLITDFMPGYQSSAFPKNVRIGMALHHEIDHFTDTHPATMKGKEYLRPASGRYCSVFMDVVYDHFLATDSSIFSDKKLAHFSQETYQTLEQHDNLLPERFQRIFYYMKKEDWLYHYRTKKGTENSFGGIYRRARYLKKSDAVYKAFLQHYDSFQHVYEEFMPEMADDALQFLKNQGYLKSGVSDPLI